MRAPVDVVWHCCQQRELRLAWDMRLSRLTWLTAPPLRRGSSQRSRGRFLPWRAQWRFVYCREERAWAVRTQWVHGLPGIRGVGEVWRFERTLVGCRVRLQVVLLTQPGPAGRIWGRGLSLPVYAFLTRWSLRRLRRLCEGVRPARSPQPGLRARLKQADL